MVRKRNVLLLVTALLVLSAGVVLGWVWTPLQRVETVQDGRGPRPWFDQLDLTLDQQKQMDKIWSDTRQQRQKLSERFREMDRQRDEQILGLLNNSQRAAYDRINDDFQAKRAELNKQRDALIADAAARSRALLDDSQKVKWDILAKEMRERRGSMGSSTRRSTTMPSSSESVYGVK